MAKMNLSNGAKKNYEILTNTKILCRQHESVGSWLD